MRKIIHVLLLSLSVLAMSITQPNTSFARNIFDVIFGHKDQFPAPPPPPVAPAKPIKKKQNPPVLQKVVPKVTPKAQDAKRILILGDFVGNATVDGLNQINSDNVHITVLNGTNMSSGLTRDDVYNWPVNIKKLVSKEKPDVIVMVIGANDAQPLKVNGKTYTPEQTEWNNIYRQRINNVISALKETGKPWIWMGLPAFKDEQLNLSIVSFNTLYKQATETAGGRFVDVWEGFVDENGKFALSGYDVNGQTVRLRANDGINFTSAGKKKLAFYLEKPLEAIFNLEKDDTEGHIAADPKGPAIEILPKDIDRVPPINLSDMAGQNNGLIGDINAQPSKTPEKSWLPKNVKHTDRVDNYSIPQ